MIHGPRTSFAIILPIIYYLSKRFCRFFRAHATHITQPTLDVQETTGTYPNSGGGDKHKFQYSVTVPMWRAIVVREISICIIDKSVLFVKRATFGRVGNKKLSDHFDERVQTKRNQKQGRHCNTARNRRANNRTIVSAVRLVHLRKHIIVIECSIR